MFSEWSNYRSAGFFSCFLNKIQKKKIKKKNVRKHIQFIWYTPKGRFQMRFSNLNRYAKIILHFSIQIALANSNLSLIPMNFVSLMALNYREPCIYAYIKIVICIILKSVTKKAFIRQSSSVCEAQQVLRWPSSVWLFCARTWCFHGCARTWCFHITYDARKFAYWLFLWHI